MEVALNKSFRILVMMVVLSFGANIANAQQVHDQRVADLVRAGKVRGALFLPQYTKDPSGELRGAAGGIVMIALARALATRLAVELVLIAHPTPGKATE